MAARQQCMDTMRELFRQFMSKLILEARLALLKERLAAFLSLSHRIIEHGGIASQLLNTSLTIQFGIQAKHDNVLATEDKGKVTRVNNNPNTAGGLLLIVLSTMRLGYFANCRR